MVKSDPEAELDHLSEEHGHINISRSMCKYRVRERLTVIPNHVCSTVNMHNDLWCQRRASRDSLGSCWARKGPVIPGSRLVRRFWHFAIYSMSDMLQLVVTATHTQAYGNWATKCPICFSLSSSLPTVEFRLINGRRVYVVLHNS